MPSCCKSNLPIDSIHRIISEHCSQRHAGNDRSQHTWRTPQDQDIDTTHALIVDRGIAGLSIRAVAEEINYSPAALYRYFDSKEALVDAVRGQCFERLNTALMEAMQQVVLTQADAGAAEQLFAAGLAYIHYARQHPADYHLMFQLNPSTATQAANRQVAMSALLYIVRYGIERGDFVTRPDYGEDAIIYQCWATVHGLAMLQAAVMQDEQAGITAVTEPILRQVIAGFAAPG